MCYIEVGSEPVSLFAFLANLKTLYEINNDILVQRYI